MTLVAVYERSNQLVVLSDVLLSSSEQFTHIQIPTRSEPHIYKERPEGLPSGYVQKITFINRNIAFCWAGNRNEAVALSEYLRDKIGSTLDPNIIVSLLESYPQGKIGEGKGKVCGVILIHFANAVISIHVGLIVGRRRLPKLGEGWYFGSGFYDLETILQGLSESRNLGPLEDAIYIVAAASAGQFSEGFGLEDLWGGGFQILQQTSEGLKFLDRILIRCWVLEGTGDAMSLQRGPFYFNFYIGEMLMLCRAFGDDGGSLFAVPPLLQPQYKCTFVSGEYKAEWVLDLVLEQKSKRAVTLFNWNESDEMSTIFVAPKGSYAPVSNAKYKSILTSVRSSLG